MSDLSQPVAPAPDAPAPVTLPAVVPVAQAIPAGAEVFPTFANFAAQTNPDVILPAICDPARWRILRALLGGKAYTAVELGSIAHRSRPMTCKHLAVLIQAGLVVATGDARDGRRQVYSLSPAARPTGPASDELDLGCVVLRLGANRKR